MKRILLCAVLAIASAFSAHAQTITVKDLTTLEVISGASIFISQNNIELPQQIGTTNNEGEFRGSIAMGTVLISANGYEVLSVPSTELNKDYVAYLIGSNMTLSEMIVSATRNSNEARYVAQPVSAIQRKDIQFLGSICSSSTLCG